MRNVLSSLACVMALCTGSVAQAALVTFNNPSVIDIDPNTNVASYNEAGFTFSGAAASFLPLDGIGSGGSGGLFVLANSLLSGGSDLAGYPNGRRPKDDVVDISLVAVMGGLCVANGNNNALGFGAACNPSVVPLAANGTVFKLHDAVDQAVVPLMAGFPYLNTPNPGAR